MILSPGTKLLVCHRRLFDADQPRFFAGVVVAYDAGLAKVSGFTFTRDAARGFERKEDERVKLIALGSGNVIVYELPEDVAIGKLRIEQPGGHQVLLSDGGGFRMDLSERHPR